MKDKFRTGNYGYGHAKNELLEAILSTLKRLEKKRRVRKNPDLVRQILKDGADKARVLAKEKNNKN